MRRWWPGHGDHLRASQLTGPRGNGPASSVPVRLLQRLEDLGGVLAARGDAIALIGLGSVGRDLARLDEHSDLDFFVIVDDAAKPGYLASIDWLEALGPVAYSFANSVHGRKALYADGLFAEYAVFTLSELEGAGFAPGRIVWQREDAPAGLSVPATAPGAAVDDSLMHHLNEALTTLYVGLHRELRGERLSATRFIQSYAVDHVLAILDATEPGRRPRQDVFSIERGVEGRYDSESLPLASMLPGYEHNRAAALAVLRWLEEHGPVDPVMAAAIRELA